MVLILKCISFDIISVILRFTLFGAPYDFRRGPSKNLFFFAEFSKLPTKNVCYSIFFSFELLLTKHLDENKDWFIRLKELTEMAYNINENIGITFIAHSMGGRMILHFLQQMPQEWKDKYVKQVITLSVPWGGSIQSIQVSICFYLLTKQTWNISIISQFVSCVTFVVIPGNISRLRFRCRSYSKYKNEGCSRNMSVCGMVDADKQLLETQ